MAAIYQDLLPSHWRYSNFWSGILPEFFFYLNQSIRVSSCIPYSQSCLPSFNVTQLLKFIEKNYTSGLVGNCCNPCKLKGPNLKLLLEKDTKSCIPSQCWLQVGILTIRTVLQFGVITPNNQNLIFDKSSASLNHHFHWIFWYTILHVC